VVDAFCPECRADLSQTQKESGDTAQRTAVAPAGRSYDEPTATGMQTFLVESFLASKSRYFFGVFAFLGVVGFVQWTREREWEIAAVALACAVGFGLLWYRLSRGERTTVSGKSKTTEGSDTPQ